MPFSSRIKRSYSQIKRSNIIIDVAPFSAAFVHWCSMAASEMVLWFAASSRSCSAVFMVFKLAPRLLRGRLLLVKGDYRFCNCCVACNLLVAAGADVVNGVNFAVNYVCLGNFGYILVLLVAMCY